MNKAKQIIEDNDIWKMLEDKGPMFVAEYVENNYPKEHKEILAELVMHKLDEAIYPDHKEKLFIEGVSKLAEGLGMLNRVVENEPRTNIFISEENFKESGLKLYNQCAHYVRAYNLAKLEEKE